MKKTYALIALLSLALLSQGYPYKAEDANQESDRPWRSGPRPGSYRHRFGGGYHQHHRNFKPDCSTSAPNDGPFVPRFPSTERPIEPVASLDDDHVQKPIGSPEDHEYGTGYGPSDESGSDQYDGKVPQETLRPPGDRRPYVPSGSGNGRPRPQSPSGTNNRDDGSPILPDGPKPRPYVPSGNGRPYPRPQGPTGTNNKFEPEKPVRKPIIPPIIPENSRPPHPSGGNSKPYGPGSNDDKPYGSGSSDDEPYGSGSSETPYGPSGPIDSKPKGSGSSDDKPYGPGSSDDKPYGPGSSNYKPYGSSGPIDSKPYGSGSSDDKPYGSGSSYDKPYGSGASDKPYRPSGPIDSKPYGPGSSDDKAYGSSGPIGKPYGHGSSNDRSYVPSGPVAGKPYSHGSSDDKAYVPSGPVASKPYGPGSSDDKPYGPSGPGTSLDKPYGPDDEQTHIGEDLPDGPRVPTYESPYKPVSKDPIPNLDRPVIRPNGPVNPDISYGSGSPGRPKPFPVDNKEELPSNPDVPYYSPDGLFPAQPDGGELIPQPTRMPHIPSKPLPAPTKPHIPSKPVPGPINPLSPRPVPTKPLPPIAPSKPVNEVYPDFRDLCQSLQLNRFLTLINTAGMNNMFGGVQPMTIFAPTDEAFSKLPVHVYYRLSRDKEFLKKVLNYHIVEGIHPENEASGNEPIYYHTKAPGLGLYMKNVNGQTYINGCAMKSTNHAKNAMVQVLDEVLYPLPSKSTAEYLQSTGGMTRFYTLALEVDLFDKVLAGKEPYTVFAPTDAAFAKLPPKTLEWLSFDKASLKQLLLKHVVPGMHMTSWTVDSDSFDTMDNSCKIDVKLFNNYCTVNDVRVENRDVLTKDGAFNSVPEVLFSKDLKPREDFVRPTLRRIYSNS